MNAPAFFFPHSVLGNGKVVSMM